jgi:hypothetical protein
MRQLCIERLWSELRPLTSKSLERFRSVCIEEKKSNCTCNGLAEAFAVSFQGKYADICQVIILRNRNIAWVGTFIILHSLE